MPSSGGQHYKTVLDELILCVRQHTMQALLEGAVANSKKEPSIGQALSLSLSSSLRHPAVAAMGAAMVLEISAPQEADIPFW